MQVLSADFEWTKGDPSPDDLAKLPKVSRRTGASTRQSMWYLIERAFHMIDRVNFFLNLSAIFSIACYGLIQILTVVR